MSPADHQLHVKHEVETEEQGAKARVHNVQDAVMEEDSEEAKQHEHNQTHKQEAAHHCEVNLGLESKKCEGESDSHADANSHHDLVLCEAGAGAAKHKPFADREHSQEDQVVGVAAPEAATAGQGNKAHKTQYQRTPEETRRVKRV